MNLPLAYAEGMSSAMKKFAVSGAMYARALQGAAQRRGGMFPADLAKEISAMPRPNVNPYWRQAAGEVARIPGAIMPSADKLQHQAYLDLMPSRDTNFGVPATPRVQLQRRALMDMTGHSYPGAQNVGTLPTMPSLQQVPLAERTSVGKRSALPTKSAMPHMPDFMPGQPRPIFNTMVQSPTTNELPNFGKAMQYRPNSLRGILGAR